jgi:hypothetical protein
MRIHPPPFHRDYEPKIIRIRTLVVHRPNPTFKLRFQVNDFVFSQPSCPCFLSLAETRIETMPDRFWLAGIHIGEDKLHPSIISAICQPSDWTVMLLPHVDKVAKGLLSCWKIANSHRGSRQLSTFSLYPISAYLPIGQFPPTHLKRPI